MKRTGLAGTLLGGRKRLVADRFDGRVSGYCQQDGEGAKPTDGPSGPVMRRSSPLPVLFALWLLLNAVDAGLTLYAQHLVAPYGGSVETSFWLTRLPLGYSMAVKLFGALLVGALLVKWKKVGMVATATVAMAGVCAWNARALIGG